MAAQVFTGNRDDVLRQAVATAALDYVDERGQHRPLSLLEDWRAEAVARARAQGHPNPGAVVAAGRPPCWVPSQQWEGGEEYQAPNHRGKITLQHLPGRTVATLEVFGA